MDAQRTAIAQACLDGAYSNTMSFPESVKALMEAGFDGYHVDYRRNTRTYYRPDGETLVCDNPTDDGDVAAGFDQAAIVAAIKWAQANPPDYTYMGFNRKVTASGCAGYIVSFLGRRVLYFGRTAETHTEHFPK